MKNNITKEIIIDIMEKALKTFFESTNNENELIVRDISEWAIAFRFGVYLNKLVEEELKDYVLDSEFNKYFDKQKEMFLECNNGCSGCSFINRNLEGKKTNGRPDFIIHKRLESGHLCCIEIKKANRSIRHDIEKLNYMTCPQGKYNYEYGIILILDNKYAQIEVYSNGQCVKKRDFNF